MEASGNRCQSCLNKCDGRGNRYGWSRLWCTVPTVIVVLLALAYAIVTPSLRLHESTSIEFIRFCKNEAWDRLVGSNVAVSGWIRIVYLDEGEHHEERRDDQSDSRGHGDDEDDDDLHEREREEEEKFNRVAEASNRSIAIEVSLLFRDAYFGALRDSDAIARWAYHDAHQDKDKDKDDGEGHRRGSVRTTLFNKIVCIEICKAAQIPPPVSPPSTYITTSCHHRHIEHTEGGSLNVSFDTTLYVSTQPADCFVLGGSFLGFETPSSGSSSPSPPPPPPPSPGRPPPPPPPLPPLPLNKTRCLSAPFLPVIDTGACRDHRSEEDERRDGRIPVGTSVACWLRWKGIDGYTWILRPSQHRRDERSDDLHGLLHGRADHHVKYVTLPPGKFTWLFGDPSLQLDTAAFVLTLMDPNDPTQTTYHVAQPISSSLNGPPIPW